MRLEVIKFKPSSVKMLARLSNLSQKTFFTFDLSQLTQYGWQPRISQQGNYPNITEHVDFIRAYLGVKFVKVLGWRIFFIQVQPRF